MGFEREEQRQAEIKAAAEAAAAKKAAERAEALRTGTGLFDTASIGVDDEKDELAAATISLFTSGAVAGVENKEDVFGDAMSDEFKAIEEEERRARDAAALAKKQAADKKAAEEKRRADSAEAEVRAKELKAREDAENKAAAEVEPLRLRAWPAQRAAGSSVSRWWIRSTPRSGLPSSRSPGRVKRTL